MLLLWGLPTWGQEITSFDVPTSLCAGASDTVSFGFDSLHNIVVNHNETSLGHSEQIFLPDGIACGTLGCSYQSPVNFTGFPAGLTVSSVEDIEYVRINMEHSYIGDIYIGITCPNGQSASLMNYSNKGHSECSYSVPNNYRGWTSGSNVSGDVYLGQAYDYSNSTYICDETANNNQPGTGWNYCWSDNTTTGYSYAHASPTDDGIIYRTGHTTRPAGTYHSIIDSSNVAAHTNFYHPNQSFTALIGCPLNGEWYIEVIDGFSQDNGYIFEWELALNESLMPSPYCTITGYSIDGDSIAVINDSTFIVTAPTGFDHDTTLLLTYTIHTECGDIDTVAPLTVHSHYQHYDTVEGCSPVVWNETSFTEDDSVTTPLFSQYGCDSVIHTQIIVHPVYLQQQSATVVENDLPYSFYGRSFVSDVSDSLLTGNTVYGCDSNIRFTLTVYPNCRHDDTVSICADKTPYGWNGLSLLTSADTSVTLSTMHGADSVVTLHLTVLPLSEAEFYDTICMKDSYTFDGKTYYQSGIYTHHHENIYGCDSSTILHLSIFDGELEAAFKSIPIIVTPENPHFNLYDQSTQADSLLWIILDDLFTQEYFSYTFPDDKGLDTLPIQLIAYGHDGCTDTARANIYIDRTVVFTPNAFTPNLETNNVWRPVFNQITDLEIWIYNRQGLLVTHLEGNDASWDGTTADGTSCPQGAYVYTLMYRPLLRHEQLKKETGTILLIR